MMLLRGEPVKLSWRAAAVFGLLAEARGEVVSREDLERQVWGDVQMDYSVLSQAIKTLRRALDPAPGGESYIDTVARVGYRLAVEVVEETETTAATIPPAGRRRRWMPWVAGAVLALVVLAAGIQGYQKLERQRHADLLVDKAFHLLRRGTWESGSQAGLLFREALLLVPGYAPAQAGIAESAGRMGQHPLDHALEQARRAADSDPECSECQSILGYLLGVRMWRWQEALPHLERAVKLNPKRASHRIYLAEWLMVRGRLDEAARQAQEATRLEPENPRVWSILAAVRYFQRRYPESIQEAAKAESLDQHHPSGFLWAYHSYMQLGDDHNAVSGRAKMLASYTADANRTMDEVSGKFLGILGVSGRQGIVRAWMEEVGAGRPKEVHRYNRALWSMWAGDRESALAELEAGVKSRPYQMIYTAAEPAFAPLRGNERFRAVVRGIGLQ
jgi:tetratricopeptide (TPR) repeat protein